VPRLQRLPGFVGPAYTLANPIASDDEAINWFPSKIESGTGPAQWAYEPAPGFRATYTGLDGPIRGFFTLNGATFAVGGRKLYELTVNNTAIERADGLSNLNDQLVSVCGNGDAGLQLMINSDSSLYCFNLVTNTLTTIADQSSGSVIFQDGYFISLDPGTSTIYLSALENGLSWDPLDKAQRNDSPDKWIQMIVRPKEVWLHGSESTSVYYDSGDAGFPYVPNPSVAIPYGTPAPYSVGLLYGSPIWLANDLTIRYANGYTPQRVSTHAVEYSIRQMSATVVAGCDVFTYEDQGHAFAVFNFPGVITWAFDLVSGLWHKRGSWDGQSFSCLPVWGHTYAFGKHLVGSRTDGTIYEMSQAYATDIDGASGLRRVRRAPHLNAAQTRITYHRFQVLMETGLGLSSGQGSAPVAMLRWSDDGGQTFGNILEAGVGATGAYSTLVYWQMLGQARDRVFELTATDPIPWRLVDAFYSATVGTS
jgi:hypothetical protein